MEEVKLCEQNLRETLFLLQVRPEIPWTRLVAILNETLQLIDDIQLQILCTPEKGKERRAYVKELWKNTVGIGDFLGYKKWFLYHIEESDIQTTSGVRNLRMRQKGEALKFVAVESDYYTGVTTPKKGWLSKSSDFDSDIYLALELYIRENCNLAYVDGNFLCCPYLI